MARPEIKEEVEFTDCVFDDGPPAQYSSWSAWAGSHPKTGVYIKALKAEEIHET